MDRDSFKKVFASKKCAFDWSTLNVTPQPHALNLYWNKSGDQLKNFEQEILLSTLGPDGNQDLAGLSSLWSVFTRSGNNLPIQVLEKALHSLCDAANPAQIYELVVATCDHYSALTHAFELMPGWETGNAPRWYELAQVNGVAAYLMNQSIRTPQQLDKGIKSYVGVGDPKLPFQALPNLWLTREIVNRTQPTNGDNICATSPLIIRVGVNNQRSFPTMGEQVRHYLSQARPFSNDIEESNPTNEINIPTSNQVFLTEDLTSVLSNYFTEPSNATLLNQSNCIIIHLNLKTATPPPNDTSNNRPGTPGLSFSEINRSYQAGEIAGALVNSLLEHRSKIQLVVLEVPRGSYHHDLVSKFLQHDIPNVVGFHAAVGPIAPEHVQKVLNICFKILGSCASIRIDHAAHIAKRHYTAKLSHKETRSRVVRDMAMFVVRQRFEQTNGQCQFCRQ